MSRSIITATTAIARDRAGHPTRTTPAQRHERPVLADDPPEVYEAILLAPGEKKIDVEVDTRLPSAAIFTFHKEDHTLGNMLRTRLLKTQHVVFAAYRAVINASQALIKDLGIFSREFTKEYELRKAANAANQQQQQNIAE
ncbi:uncharacterized protein N7515_009958 [Penicillium bovifimosum]|uniref:DNA-directed RNA polymerase RBP11-like dimerisation domain-containing protein n=1 Tax=Penicillium bovifimosum TaxID=126998 RepID=A0A9W9GHK0_9EURO|nr:uncharacterized protein N7515_009958 [Penicillium bovifimosum]KAJ5120570.1 hypothetical protein N7515_009958 [Penicillium bovifimosum]